MEFIVVLVIVAVIGGILGYFVAKKKKPQTPKSYMIEGMVLGSALGLLALVVLDTPLGICYGMVIGEIIGMMIPKKEE